MLGTGYSERWNESWKDLIGIVISWKSPRWFPNGPLVCDGRWELCWSRTGRSWPPGTPGTPKVFPHCEEVGCLQGETHVPSGQNHELCRGIHAEQNAVIQAAVNGVSTLGATLYCTHQPCVVCSKILINAGIKRIVYANPYPDKLAQEMLHADTSLELEEFHKK